MDTSIKQENIQKTDALPLNFKKPKRNMHRCKPTRQISGDHRKHMLKNIRCDKCSKCNLNCTVINGTLEPENICPLIVSSSEGF